MQFRQTLAQLGIASCLSLLLIAGHRLDWGLILDNFRSAEPASGELHAAAGAWHPESSTLYTPQSSAMHHFVPEPDPVDDFEPALFHATNMLPIDSVREPQSNRASSIEIALSEADEPAGRTDLSRTKAAPRISSENDSGIPSEIGKPSDAVPLVSGGRRSSELDQLFDEEWPDATEEEREIWGEQLQGIPAEFARELLRLRENHSIVSPRQAPLKSSRPAIDHSNDYRTPVTSIVPEDIPLPEFVRNTMTILRQAQTVTLQNLLHAQTTAHKRVVPLFGESLPLAPLPFSPPPLQAETVLNSPRNIDDNPTELHVLRWRRDMSSGPCIETGRTLDVAIKGPGWLCIAKKDREYFTRNGHLVLTESRHLAVEIAGEKYPIIPSISIPESIQQIVIAPDGHLTGYVAENQTDNNALGSTVPLGSITLFAFLDDSALSIQGQSLFAPSAASGKAIKDAPGIGQRGELLQGHLEGSNVDVVREKQSWDEIVLWQQMLAELYRHGHSTTVDRRR